MSNLDPESLRPAIRAILAGADHSQITARQVRKSLVENNPALDPDLLAAHKDAINHITKSVFEALREPSTSPSSRSPSPLPLSSSKPPSTSHYGFPQHQPAASSSSFKPKKSSPKSHQTQTDAEYAKSLSRSLNSHSTRGPSSSSRNGRASSSASSSKKVKEKRKRVQSSPTMDSDSAEDGAAKNVKREKKKRAKREDSFDENGEKKVRGGAFNREMGVSEPLQAVVGGSQMSRPQTVKKIWEYVKERGLQDQSDKRYIICDDRLQAVFKVDKVHMFTMNKLLSKHLYPLDG